MRFSPVRFACACGLNLLSALLSGTAMLLFIPLLHLAGWLPGTPFQGPLGSLFGRHSLLVSKPPLIAVAVIFMLLIATIGAAEFFRQQVTLRLRLDFLFEQRRRFNQALAQAQWSHLSRRRLQNSHQMITTGLTQIAALTHHFLQLINESLAALTYLAFSAFLSLPFTLLTGSAALLLLALHRGTRSADRGRAQFAANRVLQEHLAQFLEGIKLAKARNLSQAHTLRLEETLRREQSHHWGFAGIQARSRLAFTTLSALIFAVCFLVGTLFLRLSPSVFLPLLLIYARLMPRVSGMLQSRLQVANLAPAYGKLRAMVADNETHREPSGTGDPLPFSRAIRLDNVSYAHPGGRGIFGVCAVLHANSTIAIIGPSGSGKTTLADVLLGLLVPQSGAVRIDDAVLNAETAFGWRSSVGYVPQDPFLFHGTIRDNLAWGNVPASDSRLREALRLASADFVERLPQGLDTVVGDKGNRLSGGERQRIVLARTLLGNPKVLVLDEATNALDARNEEAIHGALRSLHNTLTIILITHKAETLGLADQVLRLVEGRIVSPNAVASAASHLDVERQEEPGRAGIRVKSP